MVMFMTGADLLYLSLFAFVAWGLFDLRPF